MSYYTEFVLECDKLTFDRLVEYWKNTSWEDAELHRPEHVWTGPDDQYLMYFSINHAPYVGDIVDFLTDTIGVDCNRFNLVSKGECDEYWTKYGGDFQEIAHIAQAEYDESISDTRRRVPAGYKGYEYCYIGVDPEYWKEYTIDYTKDDIVRPMTKEQELLVGINESLSDIQESLAEIASTLDQLVDSEGIQSALLNIAYALADLNKGKDQ